MIQAAVIVTAMIVVLKLTALAVENARINARLNYIDELVKRGFDVSTMIEEEHIDQTK